MLGLLVIVLGVAVVLICCMASSTISQRDGRQGRQ